MVAEFGGSLTLLLVAALVHGIAALILVALGWSLARPTAHRLTIAFAVVAAGLSLAQLAGEVTLVVASNEAASEVIWQSVTRADGLKMLVLAGFIVLVHGIRSRRPAALTLVTAAGRLALTLSGIGYLSLNPLLMEFAAASLPLLLVWVLVATAVRVSEPRRVGAEA